MIIIYTLYDNIYTFNDILIKPKETRNEHKFYRAFFCVINLAEMTGSFGASLNCREQMAAISIQETMKCEMR